MKKTFCCCLSTILFIIIALVGVFFGGTWFAYDKYGKAYCGVSYGEVLGLVPGLYKASEKKIVTNPFDATADLDNFEDKMKEAMFLSPDSEFSIKTILEQLLNGGTQNPATKIEEPVTPLVNQSDNPMLELLKGLNFDFSSLKDYENDINKSSKGVIAAKDTEIAALFSAAFETIVSSKMGQMAGLKTTDVLDVKQVLISGAEEGSSEADLRLTATIKLDLSTTIKGILTSVPKVPGFVSSMAATILPKSIFISLVVAPYATDVLPTVSVNEYSDKNNAVLMTMIENIFNKIGNDETKFDKQINAIDSYIKTVFTKVKSMVDLKFVGNSAELDAIYTMMSVMKLNIAKEDFLQMMSYLKCPNELAMKALDCLTYEKKEIDNFLNVIKQNYAISDSLDINKDNLTTKLGLVPNNLDLKKLDFNKTNSQMSTLMKYDAVIAILEGQLKGADAPVTVMSATSDILKNINIRQLYFIEDRAVEERIRIVIELKISDMMAQVIGNNELLTHLSGQFLPEKLFLTFEISLNNHKVQTIKDGIPQVDESGNPIMERQYAADALILVNDLSRESSEKLLDTIKSLLDGIGGKSVASQIDYKTLLATLSNTISGAIDKLENQINGKIEVLFTAAGLKLPTVYELVQSMFKLTSDVYTKEELPDQIRVTIKGLQNESKTAFEDNIKFQSTDEHNSAKLSANYTNLTDISKVNKFSKTEDGAKRYYLEATAALNIFDKNLNHTMKTPFTADGAVVTVKQTVFVDTKTMENSPVMAEKYYNDLITGTHFEGKLLLQTSEVNIENLIAMKNSLIPNSLFMTYVYNASNSGGDATDKHDASVVVNGLSTGHTALIEQIITSAQKKPFTFKDIINQTVEKSLMKSVPINLPLVTIPSIIPGLEGRINPITVEYSFNQLIQEGEILYTAVGTDELNQGTAKLSFSKSQQIEVIFSSLTNEQINLLEAIFPEK